MNWVDIIDAMCALVVLAGGLSFIAWSIWEASQ